MLEWERGRRLKKYGTVSYKYNAGGIRQEKNASGVTHVYYTDGTTIHREVITGGNTPGTLTYYYDQTGLCAIEQDSLLYYVIKNLQGDIVLILDSNGNIQSQYVYDAWGNHKIYLSSGTLIYDNITGLTSGGYANNIGVQNPFRYRGYYWDQETGLYYLNSRYYDLEIGRFINADSVSYLTPDELNGLNLYAYCLNNPVMMTDSTGCASWFDWFAGIVTGVVSAGLIIGGAILTFTGIGAPIGAVMIGAGIGMAIGGAMGGYTAYKNGDSIGAGIFAGGLVGGVVGATGALGGLAGTGVLAGGVAWGAFGIGVGASFAAGMGRYTINTLANGREFNVGKMFLDGALTAIEGAISFGMGAAFANAGVWKMMNNLKGSTVAFAGGGRAMNLALTGIRIYFTNVFAKGVTFPFRYAFL